MAGKPIDKEYLIASLKSFDEQVLNKKYNQGSNSGNGSVDLTNYYTRTETENAIDTKISALELGEDNIIESVSVDGVALTPDENGNVNITMPTIPSIDGLVTTEEMNIAIANAKLEGEEVDLSNYITTEVLNTTLGDYVKSADVPSVDGLVSEDTLNETLADYAKSTDLHTHPHQAVIDKFTESEDGKLLFNGEEIQGGGNSTNITISEEVGNAIEQKEDGIYVEDNSEEIEQIQAELSPIVKYHKYVNTELDYLYIDTIQNNMLNIKTSSVLNHANGTSCYIDASGIEYTDSSFTLKAGKTYKIQVSMRIGVDSTDDTHAYAPYALFGHNDTEYEYAKGINGVFGIASTPVSLTKWGGKNYINIIKPDNDLELKLVIFGVISSITITSVQYSICVQEINRQIAIDPVEYVNKENGIEDTPVGHIISHMGTVAPDHYLICDGAEYNIVDYPYLAQHFEEQFGSVNNFGGDGITTFAVPDLRGEFLRGTGTALRNTGSGSDVGEHQDGTQHINTYVANYGKSMYTTMQANTDAVYAENVDKSFNGFTALSSVTSSYAVKDSYSSIVSSYTARPTNTSVLYCIKYEPTYFMKNIYNGVFPDYENPLGSIVTKDMVYTATQDCVVIGSLQSENNNPATVKIDNIVVGNVIGNENTNETYLFVYMKSGQVLSTLESGIYNLTIYGLQGVLEVGN